jgi:hypothetical protein
MLEPVQIKIMPVLEMLVRPVVEVEVVLVEIIKKTLANLVLQVKQQHLVRKERVEQEELLAAYLDRLLLHQDSPEQEVNPAALAPQRT